MTRLATGYRRTLFVVVAALTSATGASHALAEGSWQSLPSMPTARSEIAAAALDGKIYVAGGFNRSRTIAAFEVYDPATNRWAQRSPLPDDRRYLAMAAANGMIYATGGYTTRAPRVDRRDTFAYDPKSNSWRPVARMPGPRAEHLMVTLGGKIYVLGGVGRNAQAVYVYDPKADQWNASASPLPTVRSRVGAAAVNGKLYVVGGDTQSPRPSAILEIYDPKTNRWTKGPPLPTPRAGLTAAAMGGRLHVTGGEAPAPFRTFGTHEIFDPTSKRWTQGQAMPTGRHALASVVAGGRWYVIGGATRAGPLGSLSPTSQVEVYATSVTR